MTPGTGKNGDVGADVTGCHVLAVDPTTRLPPGLLYQAHPRRVERGEDVFGVYDECRRQGTDWLIRASANRKVQTPAGSNSLMPYARGLPSLGERLIELRDSKHQTTRQTTLSIAAGPATAR